MVDYTKHPLWPLALCIECGRPYTLEDIRPKALALAGLQGPSTPLYYISCPSCNVEPGFEEDSIRSTVIDLLKQAQGLTSKSDPSPGADSRSVPDGSGQG
jgi:hypothetical protein